MVLRGPNCGEGYGTARAELWRGVWYCEGRTVERGMVLRGPNCGERYGTARAQLVLDGVRKAEYVLNKDGNLYSLTRAG